MANDHAAMAALWASGRVRRGDTRRNDRRLAQLESTCQPGQTVSIQALATYGENLYKAVVSIELTLVLLAAPAATAGAICLDKARGTLDHMLATDLSNAEIVLGKLGVRLVPVLGLIACVLPITALTSLLGGIDPLRPLGSFMTAIACAAFGLLAGLDPVGLGPKNTRSADGYLLDTDSLVDQPRIAALRGRFIRTSLVCQFPRRLIWEWIECSNPYYLAFAPYSDPGKVGLTTYLGFLAICLCLSALLLGLATLRIRGVALKQAGQPLARARTTAGSLGHFPTLSWWPASSRPIARRQPGLMARVAPIEAIAVTRAWSGAVHGPGNSLDCAFDPDSGRRPGQSGNDRHHEHVSGFVGITCS